MERYNSKNFVIINLLLLVSSDLSENHGLIPINGKILHLETSKLSYFGIRTTESF